MCNLCGMFVKAFCVVFPTTAYMCAKLPGKTLNTFPSS